MKTLEIGSFVLFIIIEVNLILGCPDTTWRTYQSSCYKVFDGSNFANFLSWTDAEQSCQGFGGHLVSIHSSDEQNFIEGLMMGNFFEFWIGLYSVPNPPQTTVWIWAESSTISPYTNWADSEPGIGSCVEIRASGPLSGKWYSRNCNARSDGYICKVPLICGEYPKVENGDAICTGTSIGRVCSVKCDYGYKSGIASQVECLPSGQWSEPGLKCERIKCREPTFENQPGEMTCTDKEEYGYPSTCYFNCYDGYESTGSSSINCEEDGQWSNIEPTCMDIICPSLSLENGIVDCGDDGDYRYASKCSFKCESSLTLWGPEYVVCLASGEWSDDTMPVCADFDPKCPEPSLTMVCDNECDGNVDCKKGEICCPNQCGRICIPTPEQPKKPLLDSEALKTLLLFRLIGGLRQPRPRPVLVRPPPQLVTPVCTRCNTCSWIRCRLPEPVNYRPICRVNCNDCSAHFFNPISDPMLEITRQCTIEYIQRG